MAGRLLSLISLYPSAVVGAATIVWARGVVVEVVVGVGSVSERLDVRGGELAAGGGGGGESQWAGPFDQSVDGCTVADDQQAILRPQ